MIINIITFTKTCNADPNKLNWTKHATKASDDAGAAGEKAAEPVTTVQACVSTFVSVKPVGIFKKDFRPFSDETWSLQCFQHKHKIENWT